MSLPLTGPVVNVRFHRDLRPEFENEKSSWVKTKTVMLLLILPLLLSVTVSSKAQLPNIRVGLPFSKQYGFDGPRIDHQAEYPVKRGVRDIPFGERYLVNLTYYSGLPEQPLYYVNKEPRPVACCYSFNAYWTANAALHPYWFQQFGLKRMCRQDVCLSIWLPDCSHDLMFKVTDVCDPKDCPSPLHVKVEPYKGRYLFHESAPGARPKGPVHMYFAKCWADGLAQPDLVKTLPGAPLINSRHWMLSSGRAQWRENQDWNKRNQKTERPLGDLCRQKVMNMSWFRHFMPSQFPTKVSVDKITKSYACKKAVNG